MGSSIQKKYWSLLWRKMPHKSYKSRTNQMSKKVIITGVTGQDGSHMADYLLKETDYTLYGAVRRLSVKNHENIEHLEDKERFSLINMDLTDAHSIRDVIMDIKPDFFINFAAQSFVAGSWDYPIQTW